MRTTLDAWCAFRGQRGGTIHDAQRDFDRLTERERDRFCGIIADNTRDISDLEHAVWFMRRRNALVGMTGQPIGGGA